MKKRLGLLIIILINVSQTAYAGWEWWNEDGIEYKINKNIKILTAAEQKFMNNMRDIYCYNFVFGAIYEFNKYWDIGISYKYEREREFISEDNWGSWLDEHRLQLDPAIIKWEWYGFKFSDKNGIDYRDLRGRGSRWRYRNRLKIKKSVICCGFEFTPFISDEIFYDSHKDGLYENRFAAGISKELASFIELEIYYMSVDNRENDIWGHSADVFGTIFVLNF